MLTRNDPVHMQFWLNEKDAAKFKKDVTKSGLSYTAYFRQLINGQTPQPLPTDELERILDAMRDIADSYRTLVTISKAHGLAEREIKEQFDYLCGEILKLTQTVY